MYIEHPSEMMYREVIVRTINVIEQEEESHEEYHQRKKKEEGRKRVPFGFGIREVSE